MAACGRQLNLERPGGRPRGSLFSHGVPRLQNRYLNMTTIEVVYYYSNMWSEDAATRFCGDPPRQPCHRAQRTSTSSPGRASSKACLHSISGAWRSRRRRGWKSSRACYRPMCDGCLTAARMYTRDRDRTDRTD